jgi:hypothetical protein
MVVISGAEMMMRTVKTPAGVTRKTEVSEAAVVAETPSLDFDEPGSHERLNAMEPEFGLMAPSW